MSLVNRLKQTYYDAFQAEPQVVVRAAGRINLIGEHTDYNEGFVLPAAIDKSVYVVAGGRTDDQCHFIAHDLGQIFETNLSHLEKTSTHTWANYLMGVLKIIQDNSQKKPLLRGVNIVFGADLPSGAGLSSSAAIENGVGLAVDSLFDLGLSPLELVAISQKAENSFVGMKCGIMDMFASMMGTDQHFMRIDCRDLSHSYFPFKAPDLSWVLCDTRVKHTLVDSEYNTRRAECEEGVQQLQTFDPHIRSLRDVSETFLNAHRRWLRPVVYERCRYVVMEQERVLAACQAIENQNFISLGKLMYATHEGLSRAYEVSCPELDFLVEKARHTEGVLGARMMGGGFGGCTLNLIKTEKIAEAVATLEQAYEANFGLKMPHYVVKPSTGTTVIERHHF